MDKPKKGCMIFLLLTQKVGCDEIGLIHTSIKRGIL